MRPLLVVRNGDDEGLARKVGEDPVVVGRARDCGLTLSDPEVSRRHARLTLEGILLRIEDLDSVQGTQLNGRRLAGGETAELKHRDVLKLASTELLVLDLARLPKDDVAAAAIIGPGEVRVPLRKGKNLIGSSDQCDLIVEDDLVAPQHAALMLDDRACRVVRVPGAPLIRVNADDVQDQRELVTGDVLELAANATFEVEIHRGTGETSWVTESPRSLTAEDEGDRTAASTTHTSSATDAIQPDELRSALDKARERHAAAQLRGTANLRSGLRSVPTPGNETPGSRMTPPPMPPQSLRAARREAAVRIHVHVPSGEALVVLLREGRHFLGHSDRCRVKITHASIGLEHAEIHVGPEGIRIRALTPDGLILRDGKRLSDTMVQPGDKVTFGQLEASFEAL